MTIHDGCVDQQRCTRSTQSKAFVGLLTKQKMARLATGPRVGGEDTGPVGSEGSDVVKSCVGMPHCPLASLPQPRQRPGPLGEEPAAVEHSTVTTGSLCGEWSFMSSDVG